MRQSPSFEPVWIVTIRVLDLFVRVATRLRVVGLDNIPTTGPALIVANHVSFLDPVVLVVLGHRAARRRTRFVGVKAAFEHPVTGFFIRAGRHIPVGATPAERMVTIRQARAALDRGDLVLIYPEGTIAAGPVAEAKGGAGLLAISTGVPVIPIATRGLERGSAPWWRRRSATAVIGPPVNLSAALGATGRQRYELASTLALQAIRELQSAAAG